MAEESLRERGSEGGREGGRERGREGGHSAGGEEEKVEASLQVQSHITQPS